MTLAGGELATWELTDAAPDEYTDPAALDRLEWIPAVVPGTAAASLRSAGRWRPGDGVDYDARDWWFRTSFAAERARPGEEVALVLEGVATVCEVYLNGQRLLDSESMFERHELDVSTLLRGANELTIRCRALSALLRVSRRPRARWRTRLVAEANLRFFRTMLLGRAPGFAPEPAAVGPWKPVRLERRRLVAVERLRLMPRLDGDNGRLSVDLRLRPLARLAGVEVEASGRRAPLELRADGSASGELVIPDVERWWPHTHGNPTLYPVRIIVRAAGEEVAIDAGRVGFRSLSSAGRLEPDGLQLRVNEVPVFARGAVWTPADPACPATSAERARPILEAVTGAGMNMVRVPGIGCYESEQFHDLLDELGILLWQDFMFANLDYPEQDERFMAVVEREARQVMAALAPRPSLAVLCGGSEVAQQVAMLGLDPSLATGPLYGELLPRTVAESGADAPYVPSTPWGGDLPFRPNRGVANYYGVGAYLRPLSDARLAEVKFAGECLAFANVPDPLDELDVPVHHPRWKAAVPRDVGAGWDFEDVRDHYLRLLFGLDPADLRYADHERYLELSREVTGEVMSEVFGEWRREGSPCGGGLVLWLTDQRPGAGWGLLDSHARPKVALHHLRRALAPVAVWSTDEGLGGVVAHVANDSPAPLEATLRIACYRDHEVKVEEAGSAVRLDPHCACAQNVEELLGRFIDASRSYRFGPPGHDLIAFSLERDGELLSQSFRLIGHRPLRRESAAALGLGAAFDGPLLTLSTRRFAYGVRVCVPGLVSDDDAFSLEPGHERRLRLRAIPGVAAEPRCELTALNLAGRVMVKAPGG